MSTSPSRIYRRLPLRLGAIAAILCAAAVAGCGSGPNYGSKSLTNFTPKPAVTPTPSPTATVAAAPVAQATQAPKPVPPPPPPPPPPKPAAPAAAQTQVITIQDASAAPNYYQPSDLTVKSGTLIKFVNQDSVTRIVKADNGAWSSPPIAPGGSWTYTTGPAGSYPYHDQRPYAGGTLTVN
ncbi:MAG: hypothetical protein ABR573_03000 [Candidatus Dormibacteria bacterium]